GLLGLRIGDAILAGEFSGGNERWEVVEIIPAIAHAARAIIATFADNFPSEPFFVQSMRVGSGDSAGDWASLISMLQERRERVLQVVALYHEQVLPIGVIASLIGADVPELMRAAATDPTIRPLLVEWVDAPGYRAAAELAASASTVVVTRSAL